MFYSFPVVQNPMAVVPLDLLLGQIFVCLCLDVLYGWLGGCPQLLSYLCDRLTLLRLPIREYKNNFPVKKS